MKAIEMQQQSPMFPVMQSFPSTNITTEQIQKYLDENKKLILAIMDNQNLGKLAECAQYQALLQKNLMYLASIADAQPQTPAVPSQMSPHPVMQQGGFFMHNHQAAAMAQQPGAFTPRAMYNPPHPMQDAQQQFPQQPHPQSTQGQMAVWPVGATNGIQPLHNTANLGPSNTILNSNTGPTDNRGGNKLEKTEGISTARADGLRISTITHGSVDGDKSK